MKTDVGDACGILEQKNANQRQIAADGENTLFHSKVNRRGAGVASDIRKKVDLTLPEPKQKKRKKQS